MRRWLIRSAIVVSLIAALGGWVWYRGRSLRSAREAFEKKTWYAAIGHAQDHLVREPQDDEARRIIAKSYSRVGEWSKADAAFAAIRAPTPDDLSSRGDELVQQSQWFEAASVFEQLLHARDDDPHALQQLAVLRCKQGRELEAISFAKRLVEQPEYASVGHAMLATLHQSRDNVVGAVDSWKKVIELDPEGKKLPRSIPAEKVRLDLVSCLLILGRWEDALPYLDYLESRWPEEAQVRLYRGWAWLYQGEVDTARNTWEQVLQVTPESPDVLTKLGELELQTGRVDVAVSYLKRSLELRADHAATHSALASAYRILGELELSRTHLARSEQLNRDRTEQDKPKRFMKLDPSSQQGKLAMGLQLAREGKWHDAEVWVREVLRADPEDNVAQSVLEDIRARRMPPEPKIQ